MNIVRYAVVQARRDQVEPYLPTNYEVIHEEVSLDGRRAMVVIEGRDDAGWTLHGYVLPRLASGLHFGEEIDLSHPIMKAIPA